LARRADPADLIADCGLRIDEFTASEAHVAEEYQTIPGGDNSLIRNPQWVGGWVGAINLRDLPRWVMD
jgi:hypothetical protein